MKVRLHARVLVPATLAVALGVGAPPVCLGQDLEQAAAGFATQWATGDVSGLQSRFSESGVRVQWEERPLGALSPQRAGASVRE